MTPTRTIAVNGLIGLVLALMLLQGLPLNMQAATNSARYLGDWLGIGHETWNMYAPDPDRQNHRLTAEIMSSDEHVIASWSTPKWPMLSAAERFRLHRWSEYYDHVWMNNNADCWPALARHVVNTTPRQSSPDVEPPRQVRLIAETKLLKAPEGNTWPAPIPPEGYDDRWVLKIEPLP